MAACEVHYVSVLSETAQNNQNYLCFVEDMLTSHGFRSAETSHYKVLCQLKGEVI